MTRSPIEIHIHAHWCQRLKVLIRSDTVLSIQCPVIFPCTHTWNSHQEQFVIQDLAQGLLDMQPELPIGALTLSLVDDLLDLPSCPGCAWEIKSLIQLIFKHEINIHPNFSRLKQPTTILIRRCILLMSSSSVVVITLARWKWSLCGQEKSLFPLMVLCVPVSWISFSPVQTWSWSLHLLVLVCFLVIVHLVVLSPSLSVWERQRMWWILIILSFKTISYGVSTMFKLAHSLIVNRLSTCVVMTYRMRPDAHRVNTEAQIMHITLRLWLNISNRPVNSACLLLCLGEHVAIPILIFGTFWPLTRSSAGCCNIFWHQGGRDTGGNLLKALNVEVIVPRPPRATAFEVFGELWAPRRIGTW